MFGMVEIAKVCEANVQIYGIFSQHFGLCCTEGESVSCLLREVITTSYLRFTTTGPKEDVCAFLYLARSLCYRDHIFPVL